MKRIFLSLIFLTMIVITITELIPIICNTAEIDEYIPEVTKVEITNNNGEKLIFEEKMAQELLIFFQAENLKKESRIVPNEYNNIIQFYTGLKKVLIIQACNPKEVNEQAQVIINNEVYKVHVEFYKAIKQLAKENRFRLSE